MSSKEKNRGGNESHRRNHKRYNLSIVRTLVSPHPEVSTLIEGIQTVLGPAFEADVAEKGVVLLESRAILSAIRDRRGKVDRSMLADTESGLREKMRENDLAQTPIEVRIDKRDPLRMFGRHKDVLALNLVADMRLGADRGAIETFVDTYYPNETDLKKRAKPLVPHITLGKIKPQLLANGTLADLVEDTYGFLNSPPLDSTPFDRLIYAGAPDSVVVPEFVALNGLRIQVETH